MRFGLQSLIFEGHRYLNLVEYGTLQHQFLLVLMSRLLSTLGVVELPEERFIDVYVCSITGTYDIYLRLIGDEYSVSGSGYRKQAM